ncbi:putative ribonuclease H-like domain-containing protein [Tanacetum coccineum]
MLTDSKLPITFWAKAVNTACYVQNRVLVVKPHNKTPYELFRGRTPALDFMRPFGCHVTILNTLDYLGKFDGKSDDGFFVGYSLNSKAFRVYNIRTRKVEENLHIRFLEDKPIIACDGPKWLFDIDVLTKSMNYVSVVACTNSNDFVDGSLFDSSSKNASNDDSQPSSDSEKKDDESGSDDQEKPKDSIQNINTVGPSINIASPILNAGSLNINTVSPTINTARSNGSQSGPNMFPFRNNTTLEATHADFFGDETEVDMSKINTTYPEPSTPNTRIHKDHSLENMIGRAQEGNPSIKRSKLDRSYARRASVIQITTSLDIGRFTLWIKAIRLFLAYASFKDFVVYQMDVKSAFLYSKIEEEVYVCQPLGFEDPEFPDKVYKVDKAHDREHVLSQTSKPLMKDENVEDVDVHLYRSMIGSLMYLTSTRPDIMFVVCACARFQVTPKVSHLHVMKRIFRYLKGQSKLGLWYSKDSPFDLESYFDSDYAGASLDRKSTTGGYQFLGSRLILWQCKKQTIVANSTTEAEYMAVASCCGQVLWIQNQMLDYGYNFMNTKILIDNESTICIVKNLVFHSKTKHIEIRHHSSEIQMRRSLFR